MITAYQKRFEEMRGIARVVQSEGTQVSGQRLIVLILLITIAHSTATM